jgi:UDP-glucose 4-epimerase
MLPLKYYNNNLVSLINLLGEMEIHGIRDIVFSSSCTVYGQPDVLPVTEEAPIKKAASPYGNTKQIAEEIITDVSNVSPLQAILLRYFNPIGAHESALIGELPLGIPNNLMPFITQTAMGKREYLSVFGTDYHTPDGTAIRDYIHVVDLAQAHVVAIERMLNGKNKQKIEIFNLGTGIGYSVLDVIKSFERSTNNKLEYRFKERRPGDVQEVWADTDYANKELGWKAKKDLDEMTLSAWNWEKRLAGQLD